MLHFKLDPRREYRLLCLGAHSDDIEIGCGGAVMHLIEQCPQLHVRWEVFSASPGRRAEALSSAECFLQGAGRIEVNVGTFRDGFFPYLGAEIKEYFEQIKAAFTPDLVFTHYRDDRHQDHRLLSDLAWNTFRNHLILEYEIPKYDGDLGTPNVLLPLSETISRRKVRHLLDCFQSQRDKQWFSEDTFLALMRLRGIETGEVAHYAEAFYGRKLVI